MICRSRADCFFRSDFSGFAHRPLLRTRGFDVEYIELLELSGL